MPNTVALDNSKSRDKKQSIKRSQLEGTKFSKYVEIFRKLLLLNEKNDLATTLKNIQELMNFSEKSLNASQVTIQLRQ